jgi:hypothetical protein
MIEVLTLIAQTEDTDDFGDPVLRETTRDVFGRLGSIGQTEFYQAHAVGLKPEVKFILADYLDYDGETLVEIGTDKDRQRYSVLRTFRTGQELELVLYREVNPA